MANFAAAALIGRSCLYTLNLPMHTATNHQCQPCFGTPSE